MASVFTNDFTYEFGTPSAAIVSTLQAPKPTLAATISQSVSSRFLTTTITAKKPTLLATATHTFATRTVAAAIAAKKPTVSSTATQTMPVRTVSAALIARKPTLAAVSAVPVPRNITAVLHSPRPTLKGTIGAVRLAIHSRAPSWRTVNAGTGVADASWPAPLDPNALLDFTADWNMEMSGDAISAAFVQLSNQAAAAGIVIHAESHDSDSITLWLKVDPYFQGSASWGGVGESHKLRCRVSTQLGRIHDRTFGLTVRHT